MSTPDFNTNPIFILGILPRSGTNFFYNLLCLHPDCDASVPIPEDHLIHGADALFNYKKAVTLHWQPMWNVKDQEDIFLQYLGKGLVAFLNSKMEDGESSVKRRVVTKTPSVRNLDYFFKLFPNAHLILLVRDGRAAVESNVKSFNSNYDTMMKHWAAAAETILRFDQVNKNRNHNYLIVKYEDLWHDGEKELRRVFSFLGLEADAYDFEAAINLPVAGSSEQQKKEDELLNWEIVEKTAAFKPVERWNQWGRALHERFNWIAGSYLTEFDYELKTYSGNRLYWTLYNYVADLRWQIRNTVRTQIFNRLPGNLKQNIIRRILRKKALVQTFQE